VMRGNRRRDTLPELALRRKIHALGMRFRVDMAFSAGRRRVRPDVVFPRRRVAVFVDGCFWHGCPEHFVRSRSNPDYWNAKLAGNISRDRADDRALVDSGWRVLRIWGHESAEIAAQRIHQLISVP